MQSSANKTLFSSSLKWVYYMLLLGCMNACANIPDSPPEQGQYLTQSEVQDFEDVFDDKGDGLTARFDPNWLMSDSFFLDS